MLTPPFPPWPNFTQEEADAVSRVLLSNKVNYWTGVEAREFEKEFATFAETNHAIALANGTVALDLALVGLGIGSHNGGSKDDEVIVTPRSFVASVSCVVNAGARPVFADVNLDSQNITPETVEPHITANTKAILCVHLFGWPCDMDGFRRLTEGKNIRLIEDCAQAHGAKYKGKSVGGLGDVAAWSFCQDKIMTTGGEGGMVTCNDEDLWKKMWAYKDHGKNWDSVYNTQHPPGFRWVVDSFGTNWRMTEMQAAIGRIQLRHMEEWHDARTKNANHLINQFDEYTGETGILRIPLLPSGSCEHAWYKFSAFVRPENLGSDMTRDTLVELCNKQGLPCMQGSCSEIYLEKAFDHTPFRPDDYMLNSRMLGETSLVFLIHPGVEAIEINI